MKKIRKWLLVLEIGGPQRFFSLLKSFVPYLRQHKNFPFYRTYFMHKDGLEIGGPSKIFTSGNILPIYPLVSTLDGCNFAHQTIWTDASSKGGFYHQQYICEATNLKDIADRHYDFVIASHCLEHIANPLKALKEWQRVLKPGGILLLVLPDKNMIFDRGRQTTTVQHLIKDFADNVGEADMNHYSEVLAEHDLRLDPRAGDRSAFVERLEDNMHNRTLHHHVFDHALLEQVFAYMQLEILSIDFAEPEHIIIMGRKG